MRKKCSSDQEKVLKLEDEGREFFEISKTIYLKTVKGQNNLW